MCDLQGKLIAWLDCELPSYEAVEVERHIEGCKECRNRLAAYRQVCETFDVYCDAVVAAKTHGRIPRWVPVLASAIAAAVAIFLAFPPTRIEPTRVEPPPVFIPTITAASIPVPTPQTPESAPAKKIRRRHSVPPVQGRVEDRAVKWQPMETDVQIAIPAEAMLPPGAMPNGLNFIVELSIAPDGSVRQIRLRQ
jgi:anti-sigma factor RsiW